MKPIGLGALILLFCPPLFGTPLTEKSIPELIQKSPSWAQIEAGTSGQLSQAHSSLSQFEVYGIGSVGYGESKEDPIFQFAPIFNTTRSASVGLKKKFKYGVSAQVEGFDESISSTALNLSDAHRTGARVSMALDLYSNFLGRVDHSIAKQSQASIKIAKHYDGFNKNKLTAETRKLYWAYVSANQSKTLLKSLLKTAEQQLNEISKKTRVGAADRGDLARARSLVSSRKTQLSLYEFQEIQIFKAIKRLLPSVSEVDTGEQTESLQKALSCILEISQLENPPESSLSEIADLLKEQQKYSLREAKTTSDVDLKLTGQYESNAVGNSFSNSYNEFSNHGKQAYQVGVALEIPLSGEKRELERSRVRLAEQKFNSEIQAIDQNLKESHRAAKQNIRLLAEALKEQKSSIENLDISLSSARTKFSQARISLRDYIYEQDKVFQSRIEEIQTKQQMINEVLDYIEVFDKFQCSFKSL